LYHTHRHQDHNDEEHENSNQDEGDNDEEQVEDSDSFAFSDEQGGDDELLEDANGEAQGDESDEYFDGEDVEGAEEDTDAVSQTPVSVTKYCYQPNDADCDDTSLEPAECGGFATDAEADQACGVLCSETEACVSAERPVSSFCMTWKEKPVCFGLYVKEKAPTQIVRYSQAHKPDHKPEHFKKICYQPRDRHCHDRKLKPVRCGRRRPDHD
jgi:hypothetical protein